MLEPLSETDVGRKFGGTPSVVPACTLDDAVTVTVLGAGEQVTDGWSGMDVDVGPEVGVLEWEEVVRGEEYVDEALVIDVEPGREACHVWVVCEKGEWNGITYPLRTARPIHLLLSSSLLVDMYPAHSLSWKRRNSLYCTSTLRRY